MSLQNTLQHRSSYDLTSTMSDHNIQPKPYDLIVLGASGYTGKLCAEYISKSLPTNLKWAIAGRSEGKLIAIMHELRSMSPDRPQPGQFPLLSSRGFL